MSDASEKRSPKRKMRGGMDPGEMSRLRWKKQREREKEAAKKAPVSSEEKDFRAYMERLGTDSRVPAHVQQKALQYLLDAGPPPDESKDWRKSVQVRPDFEPPNWKEVLLVAKAAGAFEVKG